VPSERYDESVESVIAYLNAYRPPADDPYLMDRLLSPIAPRGARCGLDLALYDLIGKDCGKPLYRLLGLDPERTPLTSFTIGISEPELLMRKVDELGSHPVMKVKLGSGSASSQVETIAAIRSRYAGTIRIDANEGWTPEDAVAILRDLERFDIEFCEQPVPAGHPERLRYVRERVRIPIVTDEDSVVPEDLPRLAGCVDGVNVKLVKCGGIRVALEMIAVARALGMRVMLGCMVESAISATAAAHLSPLVDWADIDGPFLTKDDPFSGVSYRDGKLILPDAPGLGVRERRAAA
jgi:L-alanine-DL-glutamate epimerase-like enolase superfamily enzyme